MAWRVIASGGETWHVQAAAERRANAALWQLMLAFRPSGGARPGRTVWAPYPLESISKSSLFLQADRIPDEELRALLVQHIG